MKVTIRFDDGSETIIDIFSADDFLGESSLLGGLQHSESALALDNVSLMSWTTAEIEEQSERQPKLGIALIQMLIKRGLDYQARLESFALDKTPERVVRSLLRFADRMGTRTEDGCIGIPPLTHQVLAQYVGTTREIITLSNEPIAAQGPASLLAQGNSDLSPGLARLPARHGAPGREPDAAPQATAAAERASLT